MRTKREPSQDEEKNGQEPLLPPIQPVIGFGSVVIIKLAARPSTA
ncbi:MAG: hypothetical protein ACLRSD_00530 [Oscillibacter sp.]